MKHLLLNSFILLLIVFFGCKKGNEEILKPIVNFGSDKTEVLTGDSIQFVDSSSNTPSDYLWYFDGATPNSSVLKAPKVQYSKPGNYCVSLKVSNQDGSDSITKIDCIKVNPITIDSAASKFTYVDINPDIIIHSNEELKTYEFDINTDGIEDFQLSVLNHYYFGGMALSGSNIKIKTLNESSFVLLDSTYPKILFNGDTIQLDGNWASGEFILLKASQGCCPPTSNYYVQEGVWKDVDKKNIGICFKDNSSVKYGWIKIGIHSCQILDVYEYAITQ